MKKLLLLILVIFMSLLFVTCGKTKLPQPIGERVYEPQTILALGDSLTYGQGVGRDDAYPAQLERALHAKGFTNYTIVNSGVSGERTDEVLKRLEKELDVHAPDLVILTIGANDVFQRKGLDSVERNIELIIEQIQGRDITVLLSGMRVATFLGGNYTKEFKEIYPRLAVKYNVRMVDHFLAGVGGKTELNQKDLIHPTKEGYEIIAEDNILPELLPLLGE